MTKTNRYIVTSAYNEIGTNKLEYLSSHTNRVDASYAATLVHRRGGRALVHDRQTGLIIRDTGKCLGQVWGGASRKGQKSPEAIVADGSQNLGTISKERS